MYNSIEIFGSDFDPNPDIECIRRKLFHFINSNGNVKFNGPYDIFEYFSKEIMSGYLFSGKIKCPNWVSATPRFSREIYPEMYREYINKGNCRVIANAFGNAVASNISPGSLPVSIGVDHCLTGGVYRALKKSHDSITLVVFDMHLDAITPYTRNRLVGYYNRNVNHQSNDLNGYEYYDENFIGNYDTGSFLSFMVQEGILKWSELIVLGTQDAPDPRLRTIEDDRVKGYLEEYDSITREGASICPLSAIQRNDFKERYSFLKDRLSGEKVYVSVDMDVFSGNPGLSARYGSNIGISKAKVSDLLNWMGLNYAELIGMDIMEADVNIFEQSKWTEKQLALMFNELIDMITHPAL